MRGKVISFDRIKGYGFVSPDTGGEDVFIHVNDLLGDKSMLSPGCIVDFRLEDGDRGPKASAVTMVQPAADAATVSYRAPEVSSRAVATSAADDEGDDLCDSLSVSEFEWEVTEALLRVEPELASGQILDARKRLLRIAQGHGWAHD